MRSSRIACAKCPSNTSGRTSGSRPGRRARRDGIDPSRFRPPAHRMKLKFTKMQGAGNDFVVIDGVSRDIEITPERARRIADRHFGVGCDQVLLVEKSQRGDADFRYRIWNADGGEVEQCGNGARCFVRFVHDRGLTKKKEIRVETLSGVIVARRLQPVPRGGRWPLEVAGRTVQVAVLSMGNPHAVQTVADVDSAPVTTEGPLIERHPRLPNRVNAGYMQVLDRARIRLRVWERGAGETLACGSGACAAVVAGIREGLLDASVRVATRGGELTIRWGGGDTNLNGAVWIRGPPGAAFEGRMEIES